MAGIDLIFSIAELLGTHAGNIRIGEISSITVRKYIVIVLHLIGNVTVNILINR